MRGKYRLANGTLVIVLLGFLFTYPFSKTFYGGLIFSGFCAALIGGLADWFAVTALFRKPLGISSRNLGFKEEVIRTEIIPKNKEKIINILRDMVNKELLTKEVLQAKVQQLDIVKIIMDTYEKEDTKKRTMNIVSDTIIKVIYSLDEEEIAMLCHDIVKMEGNTISLSDLIRNIIQYSNQNNYDEKAISFILKICKEIIETKEVLNILVELIENTRVNYSEGNNVRKMANTLLFGQILKTSPYEMAKSIQSYITTMLMEMENPGHPYRLKIKEKIEHLIVQLETDDSLRIAIEKWKERQLRSPFLFDLLLNTVNIKNGELGEYVNKAFLQLEYFMVKLQKNKNDREIWNGYLRSSLTSLIDNQHEKIDLLMMSKLNSFTNEALIELIENKAGDDLQMIRINGTVVGGLVGIILYLLTNWL